MSLVKATDLDQMMDIDKFSVIQFLKAQKQLKEKTSFYSLDEGINDQPDQLITIIDQYEIQTI